jgi:peptidoglycan/xylan/chitin deacetylase (PgdA/CDA1 family)
MSLIRRAPAAVLRRLRGAIPRPPRPTILMYHRIAVETFDPWGLAVSPAHFAEQLQWLSGHRTVLPLVDLAARHRDGTLPANAIALTFDDGYACTAEVAAPMLERAGLPATIFISAELIERGEPFWWDELKDLVLDHDRDILTVERAAVSLGARSAGDRHWKPGANPGTPRQAAFHRIWNALREKPPAEIDSAMSDIRRQSHTKQHEVRPMSPAQVRETAAAGIDFGSHALAHPWLTSLTHAEKAREIRDSVEACEKLSGTRPTTFAYPYGNFDAESERIVEEAGFDCACATLGRSVSGHSRPFALPRVQVGDWSARELRLALGAA